MYRANIYTCVESKIYNDGFKRWKKIYTCFSKKLYLLEETKMRKTNKMNENIVRQQASKNKNINNLDWGRKEKHESAE